MTDFEFDLIFTQPKGEFNVFELSDAVFEAGFEDAVVGTGQAGLLAVALEAEGEDAESVIVHTAHLILQQLPNGYTLHEVRSDLVSLADVAKKHKAQEHRTSSVHKLSYVRAPASGALQSRP